MKQSLPLILAIALVGCALNRPALRSERRETNGVVTVTESKLTSFALWPATQQIASQRLSNTHSGQGIGQKELGQEGGGTNVIEALKALDSILGKIKP